MSWTESACQRIRAYCLRGTGSAMRQPGGRGDEADGRGVSKAEVGK